jgi:tRNA threonylcarbamoyladenosine biosynthesis protein TsaB
MILTIKTDKPEAELRLYDSDTLTDEYSWVAGRELSNQIMIKVNELLAKNNLNLKDLGAVIVFRGPGSFTGLRIGVTVANTIGYSLNIPVIGGQGTDWIEQSITKVTSDDYSHPVSPIYGAPVNITKQRK